MIIIQRELHYTNASLARKSKVTEESSNDPFTYFDLEVWPLFEFLGLLLWRSLNLVLLLVSLQPPQLLLNTPPLLPHLFSVLLIEDGKLLSATTKTHNDSCFKFTVHWYNRDEASSVIYNLRLYFYVYFFCTLLNINGFLLFLRTLIYLLLEMFQKRQNPK